MPAQTRPGFTLIEIVLVLLVMAIAGVLAYPALQPALETTRTEGAARRTAAFLDDARRRAVLARVELEVACDPREGRLRLRGLPGDPRDFAVPDEVALVSCRPDRVRYFPQGSSTGMSLLLRDPRGRGRLVTVGAFTGLAGIAEEP